MGAEVVLEVVGEPGGGAVVDFAGDVAFVDEFVGVDVEDDGFAGEGAFAGEEAFLEVGEEREDAHGGTHVREKGGAEGDFYERTVAFLEDVVFGNAVWPAGGLQPVEFFLTAE